MAVVMLSENCNCQYMDKIRYAPNQGFCGCLISEDADIPFLSKRGNIFGQIGGAIKGAVQKGTAAVQGAVQQGTAAVQGAIQNITGGVQTAVQTASDPNFCPACHRVVDNIGDTVVNLTGLVPNAIKGAGNIVNAVTDSAGEIISVVPAVVQNVPCIINSAGQILGAPTNPSGCAPQGFNEQNRTLQTARPGGIGGINPLLLIGAAGVAFLLLNKK
jgi:hypothetical protein